MGVGEGGFSGITPCLRRISFLGFHVKIMSFAARRFFQLTILYPRLGRPRAPQQAYLASAWLLLITFDFA
jgi:hypothetical protein